MISVKCKITNDVQIDDYVRQFNNVVRFAYNRFHKDKMGINEVYHLCNNKLKNIELLNASFVECAVMEAHLIWKAQGKNKKIIFGGKKNFWKIKFQHGLAKPLEKNKNISSVGRSKLFKGNRFFTFDLTNNKVIFKPSKNVKIPIDFKISKNYRSLLDKAQILSQLGELPITVRLCKEHIVFIIDESILQPPNQLNPIKNRVLALDSNPDFLAISISDFTGKEKQNVIFKQIFDLRQLNKLDTNKRHFENLSLAKQIGKIAKHYQCEIVGFEELSVQQKNHLKGKYLNKKINTIWNRKKIFDNIKKWLNIYNIKHQDILPRYSSFIGQLIHLNETDSIAASLEIARRTYLFNRIFIRKDREKCPIMYPNLDAIDVSSTRWKEMEINKQYKNWPALFAHIKKSKLNYRFLFDDWVKSNQKSSFRHKSRKSKVFLCLG